MPPHPGCSANGNVVVGTNGADTRSGTPAKNLMFGLNGNDVLDGRGGNDCVYGNRDADRLSGGPGNDVVRGGRGDDQLAGNDGNDQLVDHRDRDLLSGGAGNDSLDARDFSAAGRRFPTWCGAGRVATSPGRTPETAWRATASACCDGRSVVDPRDREH